MSELFAFAERYFPYILKGAIVTIELTVLSLLISIALGLIAAIGKLSGRRIASAAANVYIELIRGTPALLQLFVIYFGLTSYGVNLDSFTAAVLTLGFIGGAYLAEVFRAGIQSVDRGQVEAAVSLGHAARTGDAADRSAAGARADAAALHQFRHRAGEGHVARAHHRRAGDHVPVL